MIKLFLNDLVLAHSLNAHHHASTYPHSTLFKPEKDLKEHDKIVWDVQMDNAMYLLSSDPDSPAPASKRTEFKIPRNARECIAAFLGPRMDLSMKRVKGLDKAIFRIHLIFKIVGQLARERRVKFLGAHYGTWTVEHALICC